MGYVSIPEQAHEGPNCTEFELDRSELAQTVSILQIALQHLKSNSKKLELPPGTKITPAPYTPSLHSLPRSQSSKENKGNKVVLPPVNVLTPSVAALQQKLGVDVGTGLSVGFNNSAVSLSTTSGTSLSSVPVSTFNGGLKHNIPDNLPPPIARPRSPPHRPIGGHLNDYRNSGQQSNEVLESSLRLLGIADEIGPIGGGWKDGGDEVRVTGGRQLGINEVDDPFSQPGNTHTGGPVKWWEVKGSNRLNYMDNGPNLIPQVTVGSLNPGLGLGMGNGTGKSHPAAFGQIGPVSSNAAYARNDVNTGAAVSTFSEKLGSSGQMQMHMTGGVQVRPDIFGEALATQRAIPGGNSSTRPVNPVPGSAGPGGIRANESQAGMEGGIAGQVWKVPTGLQGGLRSTPQLQPELVRIPEDATPWQGRWTTAAVEHSRECVTGMVYLPVLEGLEGGDVHSGWLISSSRRLLNLWECTSYTRPTEPALQVMHSQATEFVMESMDVDSAAKVFLALCAHPRDQGYCISLHSLSAESFFTYKGMIRVPDSGLLPQKLGIAGGSKLCHVTSLQPLGGPLRSSMAAAVGGNVLVYELAAAAVNPSAYVPPKAQWKAHSSPISALHRSSFACALFTGACDGSIRLWDLKTKPNAPVRQYSHTKQVTQIAMLDVNTMGSCGLDGMVNIWDIRSSGGALLTVNPDSTPVTSMAVGPSGKSLAFTTRRSIYCLELPSQATSPPCLSPLMPLPPAGPSIDMKWNAKTNQLYVCGPDGTIAVYGNKS